MNAKPDETAKVLRVWEKTAPGYDKQIAFFEKIWFGGGREWLGARAQGRVLEVAIGTAAMVPAAAALAITIAAVAAESRRRPRRPESSVGWPAPGAFWRSSESPQSAVRHPRNRVARADGRQSPGGSGQVRLRRV